MTEFPVRWIQVRAYCQGTEDEERVLRAIDVTVSGGTASRDVLQGQFGNRVILLRRRIDHAMDLRATWERWSASGVPGVLHLDLHDRVDKDGVLHFRINKQKAFQGGLVLALGGDAIDIQVKLKAYPAKREEFYRVARTLLSEAI
jgi:hypothetical protein